MEPDLKFTLVTTELDVRNFKVSGSETSEQWIEAVTTKDPTIFYFSAFWKFDRILIISIVERSKVTNETRCLFFYRNGSAIPQLTQGEIYLLPDFKDLRFTSSFVRCKLPVKEVPYAVALVQELSSHSIRYIPIIKQNNQIIRNFTVCVSPLFNNFNRRSEIVEMIELNRILGAQYFFFYNYSISNGVNLILNHYKDLGLVETISWHLPAKIKTRNPEEINYFAQFAAINDCLYRNKGVSQYVVYQDMDEFIIPRKYHNWNDLMASLPRNYSIYLVRSTIFRRDWPDLDETYLTKDDLISAKKYNSLTILKQFRETRIFPKKQRTKYIAKTVCVDIADIHYVWSHRNETYCGHYYVNESLALVHHYRDEISYLTLKDKIWDSRINDYKSKLLDSLNKTWTILKNVPFAGSCSHMDWTLNSSSCIILIFFVCLFDFL
ncbi:hypothetical protein FSP39_004568 [Pinctada imbricata]|uniref:Glycosyltransferase family 92 protein n=1 Tax=Pinctada imbricata TaxID=66713 RepID=A0AA88YGS2_PINIB|nr:hypothetical protein FSP39_004568 [Pinctada imbricata]